MAGFRKRFVRRRFGRRKARVDMQSIKLCDDPIFFTIDSQFPTCELPHSDAVEILSAVTETSLASGSLLFGGMTFGLEYTFSPLSVSLTQPCDATFRYISFLKVWSAICLIPYASPTLQGTPAYLPKLSALAETVDKDTDVLWKRMDTFAFAWNVNAGVLTLDNFQVGGIPFMQSTSGLTNQNREERQVRLRSKRRIDEQHGLYLVTSVHPEFPSPQVGVCALNTFLTRDFWARTGVREMRR